MRSCDSCVPAKLRLSVTNSERTGAGPLMLLLLGLLLLGLLSLEPAGGSDLNKSHQVLHSGRCRRQASLPPPLPLPPPSTARPGGPPA